jgi:hypothetical protein
MSEELWAPIKGWEEYYHVSTYGRIKSLSRVIEKCRLDIDHVFKYYKKERIRKSCYNNKGYNTLLFCRDGVQHTIMVHRIVAETFIPNPYNLPDINHINCIRSDNHVENLEWVTTQDNVLHAQRMGKMDCVYRPVWQLTVEGERIRLWKSQRDAARFLGSGNSTTIQNCCVGRDKTFKGYKWEYAE